MVRQTHTVSCVTTAQPVITNQFPAGAATTTTPTSLPPRCAARAAEALQHHVLSRAPATPMRSGVHRNLAKLRGRTAARSRDTWSTRTRPSHSTQMIRVAGAALNCALSMPSRWKRLRRLRRRRVSFATIQRGQDAAPAATSNRRQQASLGRRVQKRAVIQAMRHQSVLTTTTRKITLAPLG